MVGVRILRSYFCHQTGHRALFPPYLRSDTVTLWTITFCAEEMALKAAACSGDQTPAPGRSYSLWTLLDIIMSPGLQPPALAHTLLVGASAGWQPLSSHLGEVRRQASHLNMKQRKWKNVIIKFLILIFTAVPVPSPTWIQWLSRVVLTPWPLCPGTMTRDGWRISPILTLGDNTTPAQDTHQTGGGWDNR